MGDWITADDVTPYLGAMTDPQRVADATAAAKQYAEDRRSDLALVDMNAGEAPADVHLGTVLYASLIYQARVSPTGLPAYGDGVVDLGIEQSLAYPRAMRLIGYRRPVAL